MRHKVGGRKFGLPSDQRRALLKGLVRALLTYQKIETTETRAKDVKIIAERLITRARNEDTLHSRRIVNRYLTDETLVRHLFTKIAPEYKNRQGGYTRISKIGLRRGDAAPIVILELLNEGEFGLPVVPDKIGTVRPSSAE
jgi:large subunit ribosomal protein L17